MTTIEVYTNIYDGRKVLLDLILWLKFERSAVTVGIC
jgi:hypothetical protein